MVECSLEIEADRHLDEKHKIGLDLLQPGSRPLFAAASSEASRDGWPT
jgi:hypothetical protein